MLNLKENVSRHMNNFASMYTYNTIMNDIEVNFWLDNYSDTIICRGKLRQIVFIKIADKHYKVMSKEF